MIYDSILGTIGKTPVVRIQRLAPKHVTIYVKGALKPGQTLAMLPDTGERYLSTLLFDGIAEGGDAEP
jgi:cysteine synthase